MAWRGLTRTQADLQRVTPQHSNVLDEPAVVSKCDEAHRRRMAGIGLTLVTIGDVHEGIHAASDP